MDRPIVRPLPTQDNRTEKRGLIVMPQAGFELTITAFEWFESKLALDGAATGPNFKSLSLSDH
jgi:hypothetical protein